MEIRQTHMPENFCVNNAPVKNIPTTSPTSPNSHSQRSAREGPLAPGATTRLQICGKALHNEQPTFECCQRCV